MNAQTNVVMPIKYASVDRMRASDAVEIVEALFRELTFDDFSDYDRVYDGDGVYEMQASMSYWTAEQREALSVVAAMSPDEREFLLDVDFESMGAI